jgi:hypothetical protein
MYDASGCQLDTLTLADLERGMNGFDANGAVPVYIVTFLDVLIRDRVPPHEVGPARMVGSGA